MAHSKTQYAQLNKPDSLTLKVDPQKMFIDNINQQEANYLRLIKMIDASVGSISALRAISTSDTVRYVDGLMILVRGIGIYHFDADAVTDDDGINVIAPTTGAGRWFAINGDILNNMNSLDGRINSLEAKNIASGITLSQHKSIFTSGTGKDNLNVDKDYSDEVLGQSTIKIEGSTAVNLVKNGDFSNGSTGWTWTPTSGGVVSNNEAKITPTVQYDMFYTYLKFIANHVYYFTADIYGDGYTELLMSDNVNFTQLAAHSPVLRYEKITIYHKPLVVNNSNNSLGFRSVATSGWIEIKAKNFMFIDLTALFGAGNEPTKEQCDFMYDHYINGLQGVGSSKIVSRGSKNLFDGIIESGTIDIGTGIDIVDINVKRTKNYTFVNENTNYISKAYPSSDAVRVYYYDVNKIFISTIYVMSDTLAFTTPTNCRYVRFSFRSTTEYFQLEEGSVATEYEPYQSSELVTTMPTGTQLHRLPNGVYDSIEEVNSIRTLFKKTKEYTLVASDITQLDTTLANVDRIYILISSLTGLKDSGVADAIGTKFITSISCPRNGGLDVDMKAGTHYATDVVFIFNVSKGAYANLAAAQTALAGTKIVYELTVPLMFTDGVMVLKQEGNLEVYEDGTIYQESSINPKEYNNAKLHITYNLSDKAIEMSNSESITDINKRIIGRLKNSYLVEESGNFSNSEGSYTKALGQSAHAEGDGSKAYSLYSHAEGQNTQAGGSPTDPNIGIRAHAEGQFSEASGNNSHAECTETIASGDSSHAEGMLTLASGDNSHAEGSNTIAEGTSSHAEGASSWANGDYSHAEGQNTIANGNYSHAEGKDTRTDNWYAHAEGFNTIASGVTAHGEGDSTLAAGASSHAEGQSTKANALRSHAGGLGTIADGNEQFVGGRYNSPNGSDLFQIGNGSSDANRSNAMRVTADGSMILSGGITPNDTLGALTSTKGTIVGGYIKRGIEVVFSVKLTLTASIAINDVIVSGFPAIVSEYSAFRGCAPFLGTYFDAIISENGSLITGGAYNNGQILYISGVFISAS
jgi:hypothetical protein